MSKPRMLESTEDRTLAYSDWRRTFGDRNYVMDVDHVEYRVVDGQVKVVAILELTRCHNIAGTNTDSLREAVLHRVTKKYMQGRALRRIAHQLGVPAYLVLYEETLAGFEVFNLSDGGEWCTFTNSEYRHWIESL